MSDINPLLGELNPSQQDAVITLNGPLLVLAGAGSGKTRVLTYRMANLVLQGEATPHQILAVTFTNKAAKEMSHRILDLLRRSGVPVYEELWISTFHSICSRILREEIHALGYQPFFVIYDSNDQLALVKKICNDMGLNDKVYSPKVIQHQISQAKMLGLNAKTVGKHTVTRERLDETTIQVFATYEEEMFRANALDFDDLLTKTYELFTKFPQILQKYREKFQYIMVDEYQDTNHIQYLIVKALAIENRNLCVVGDEDQSIYSWRGADIKNILDFEKDFPEAKVIKLEENYRSTRNIVEAASSVIRNNSQRKDKQLFTQNEPGSLITIQAENNEYDEARFVVRKIQEITGTYKLSDTAIFYRTNAQSRVIEEQLRSLAVPYRIVGGMKFYDRKEIKDIICYMRLALNSNDDMAYYRIVNVPARGLGKTTLEEVLKFSNEKKIAALEASQQVAEQRLVNSSACVKLQNFKNLIEKLSGLAKTMSPSEIYLKILDETGYALKLREENTPEAESRIENLEEFQNAIMQFEKERGDEATILSFLEEMALISEADKMTMEHDAITLMTLHLSKGLEYPNVFIIGMEEGLFPSGKSIENLDPDKLEEERRLAYVGITRAREHLFLTYAQMRRVYGNEEHRPPSQFLAEIPEKYVRTNQKSNSQFLERHREKFSSNKNSWGGGGQNKSASNQWSAKSKSAGFTTFGSKPKSDNPFPTYEDFGDETFQPATSTSFSRGQRVRHPIFGIGSIAQVEGEGEAQKVSVVFKDKSLKKFMVKHARLEKV
jgi:DNA helicase-2/ATP-dependent DNA helicase PcrA